MKNKLFVVFAALAIMCVYNVPTIIGLTPALSNLGKNTSESSVDWESISTTFINFLSKAQAEDIYNAPEIVNKYIRSNERLGSTPIPGKQWDKMVDAIHAKFMQLPPSVATRITGPLEILGSLETISAAAYLKSQFTLHPEYQVAFTYLLCSRIMFEQDSTISGQNDDTQTNILINNLRNSGFSPLGVVREYSLEKFNPLYTAANIWIVSYPQVPSALLIGFSFNPNTHNNIVSLLNGSGVSYTKFVQGDTGSWFETPALRINATDTNTITKNVISNYTLNLQEIAHKYRNNSITARTIISIFKN